MGNRLKSIIYNLCTPFKHDIHCASLCGVEFVVTKESREKRAQRESCLKGVERLEHNVCCKIFDLFRQFFEFGNDLHRREQLFDLPVSIHSPIRTYPNELSHLLKVNSNPQLEQSLALELS